MYCDVPHTRMRVFGGWSGPHAAMHRFGVGPWRAPGANMNVFARESQVDVMAAAVKIDPLEFRLRNTGDERMRRVLEHAARAFGWTPKPAPSGRGWGIACGVDAGTYAALVAEVRVDREHGNGEGRARGVRPGHGDRGESRRGEDADRRLHHHGPGIRAQRGGALRRRADAGRELRHLRDPALLVAAPDRDGARGERRPRAPGRGRARHHPDGGIWPTRSSTPPASASTGCR